MSFWYKRLMKTPKTGIKNSTQMISSEAENCAIAPMIVLMIESPFQTDHQLPSTTFSTLHETHSVAQQESHLWPQSSYPLQYPHLLLRC